MASADFHNFDCLAEDLGCGKHDLSKDKLHLVLASQPATASMSSVPAGSSIALQTTFARAGKVATLTIAPVRIDAAKAVTFACCVVVNGRSKAPIGYACPPNPVSLSEGDRYEIKFPPITITL